MSYNDKEKDWESNIRTVLLLNKMCSESQIADNRQN